MRNDIEPKTLAVRAGHTRTAQQENSEPMFLTSSFCFESAEQAAARFSGEEAGNIYSRFTNPTVKCFEERLAILERGESCIATSSGMSAILSLVMATMTAGDNIVASRSIFGTSVTLFEKILPKFGINTIFVDITNVSSWSEAITANTRMLFVETPSNPLSEVADLRVLATLAHDHQAMLVVDNCFCTPALQQPLLLGADVVIHSGTKYLDGQGRCVGGAIVGTTDLISKYIFPFMRSAGTCLSPFNAWVFLKGLETLDVRMERHSSSAMQVATWLSECAVAEKVYYPGLTSHPQFNIATSQQSGFGGIVSFEVVDKITAWRFIDALSLFTITANFGDTKSIVTHPASTTHGRLIQEDRDKMGITDGLVRLSIGLESVDDLINDIQQAIESLS